MRKKAKVCMLLRILRRLFAQRELRSRTSETTGANRTILAVTPLLGQCDTLRVLSIMERWHLRIAATLDDALALRQREKITVILYDQDLSGSDWRKGVTALSKDPRACVILFSFDVSEKLRLSLLTYGGYDVARKPIDGKALATLVNGCYALMNDIDSSHVVQNAVSP
jgi:DNA-binding response OmpR family regulator